MWLTQIIKRSLFGRTDPSLKGLPRSSLPHSVDIGWSGVVLAAPVGGEVIEEPRVDRVPS
jgi:hypothetical protein